jgi:hypothetical protein
MEQVSDLGYKKPIMSVGDEFMAWAETYWRIAEKYDGHPNPQDKSESCQYDMVKKIFIDKINSIIEQRIKHYL